MKKITVTKQQLRQILATAESAIADKDCWRPVLCYAHASVDGARLSVAACDGFKLARLTLTLTEDCGEAWEFFFLPFSLPMGATGADFELADGVLTVTLNGSDLSQAVSFPQRSVRDEFVNIDKLLPTDDPALAATVDAELLTKILKPFTKTGSKNHPVRLSFVRRGNGIDGGKPVTLKADFEGGTLEALALTIRVADQRG